MVDTMFDNDFFDQWLDEEAQRVQRKVKAGEGLTSDDKIVLILKGQTNHFYHLDIELREEMQAQRADFQKGLNALREDMDKRFEQVDKRFEQVDKRIEQVDKRIEQVDKRFEEIQQELRKLYQAINTQTWKMIGAIGLIVILARLAGGISLFTGMTPSP
jgi:predicted transcriptional regulator